MRIRLPSWHLRASLHLTAAALILAASLTARATPAAGSGSYRTYLPSVAVAPAAPPQDLGCQTIPGTSYSAIPIASSPTNIPAAQDPDLNLQIRGWLQNPGAFLGLVTYGQGSSPPDPNAPQLYSLFLDNRVPTFTAGYQVYNWNWGTNSKGSLDTDWPVSLAGMQVQPGEELRLPKSGYSIYPGYQALVLYATQQDITLTFTRNDNIVYGYSMHVEGICVEPSLLALYNQMNSQGRGQLPALTGGEPFGRANASEIQVAIRDTGTFMDPRSHGDWWQGK